MPHTSYGTRRRILSSDTALKWSTGAFAALLLLIVAAVTSLARSGRLP